jgi:WD40 repeat protein
VGGEESMQLLQQSKSRWLPVSVIVEHILPLLDRVSRNRLCSLYKELYAASRKVTPPWPFKRRLRTAGGRGHTHYVNSVAFSPDSELLASGGDDGIIHIWDRTDGRCAHLEGHAGGVNDLCFSPDGKLLASASDDATIRLWKLQDQSFRVLEGHGNRISAVAFSRDGSTLASGDHDGIIRLWGVDDGRCIRRLVDESIDYIFSVAFTPDGKAIAVTGDHEDEDGADHGVIILWDISDADDISSSTAVDTHDGTVYSLQYSPDGRYFATGADNDSIRLWNAADNTVGQY